MKEGRGKMWRENAPPLLISPTLTIAKAYVMSCLGGTICGYIFVASFHESIISHSMYEFYHILCTSFLSDLITMTFELVFRRRKFTYGVGAVFC